MHLKENKKVLVSKNKSLNEDVKKALKLYFKSLDSQEPRDVYDLVMREVETPLFNFILTIQIIINPKQQRFLALIEALLEQN